MATEYTTERAAQRYDTTPGHLAKMCRTGKIKGAKRKMLEDKRTGVKRWSWLIPAAELARVRKIKTARENRIQRARRAR